MINAKRLVAMARKWQKLEAMRRRRITMPKSDHCRKAAVADKGHFVVYTADDNTRFVIPLPYLNNLVFIELFRMSEEEFGLPSNGPITLPCDAVFMEYVVWMVQSRVSKDIEKALLLSMANGRRYSSSSLSSSSSFHLEYYTNQQILLHDH